MSVLEGKRIVITRAPHQAGELADLLVERGATPIFFPTVEIVAPDDTRPFDRALRAIDQYDWLILTSANTVHALADRLNQLAIDPALLNGVAVAAIGPATADAARRLLDIEPALMPDDYLADALADLLMESLLDAPDESAGRRMLLPQSSIAEPSLRDSLEAAGAEIDAVVAYQTVIGHDGDDVPEMLDEFELDAITFTSSSTVSNFVERIVCEGGNLSAALRLCAACIGPKTAATAEDQGFEVLVTPDENTVRGLVLALETYFLLE